MASKQRPCDPEADNLKQHLPADPRRPGLLGWLRAWRDVIREPDKIIPGLDLPPEGEPLPEELGLHCPECNYNLTGLREWRCPECGQPFSPRHAHTLGMLRRPEYLLRYRFEPRTIRSVFLAVVLFLAGLALLVLGGPIALQHGSVMFLSFLAVWILPNTIMAYTQSAWPWSHYLLFLSALWLISSAVLLAVVTWL
jgi:hypothetical protein